MQNTLKDPDPPSHLCPACGAPLRGAAAFCPSCGAALRATTGRLQTQQVLAGVTVTALASQAQADVALNAIYDQREVQVARFSPKDFAAKVSVSDADLEAYYKAHTAQFQAPEQASIEYIVLDLDAAKKSVAVNDADLKAYYEQNKTNWFQDTRVDMMLAWGVSFMIVMVAVDLLVFRVWARRVFAWRPQFAT